MSYISVDFLLDKLYIKEFDINSNIINRVNEDFLSKLYIKDISGSFNVLKSNEKIKEITIPLSKYSSKRQEFLVDGINLYNDFLPNYQYISDFHYNKTKNLIDLNFFYFDFKVFEVANIDIENPKYEIRTIELFENITNKKYLFTIKKFNEVEDNSINKETFVFSSEKIMLEEFIDFIYKKDPIMLVSWFGDSFYFPYLINRCKKLNVDYLKLSPFEKFKTKKVYIFDKQINIEVPIGRYFIDYKTLLEAYERNKIDSYELITISNNVFKENKHKCLNLEELFKNGSNEYVDKVFFNVETLNRLDNKLNYIKTMIEEAWTMGINFDDVFSTIKPWTFKLYNELKKDKKVLPLPLKNLEKESYTGGYIHKPIEGKYSNIISFDISSNYTNIIRTNNISYETIVDLNDFKGNIYYNKLLKIKNDIVNNGYENYFINIASKEELKEIISITKELNLIISSYGEFFYKDKVGILPKVMQKIFKEREEILLEIEDCDKKIKLLKKELKNRGI